MSTFNYLSGSTIDNSKKLLFYAFSSGNCFLGFARSVPNVQWGINALVYIQHPSVSGTSTFPNNVASNSGNSSSNKFFDLNSLSVIGGATDANRTIYIGKVANGTTQYLPLGDLKLNYLGESWALIEGLPYDYYNLISYSPSASYCIVNANYNTSIAIKILNKSYSSIPSYTTSCFLAADLHDGSGFNVVATGLERSVNALGEISVTGMQISNMADTYIFNDSVSAMFHKAILTGNSLSSTPISAASFRLIDTNGNIIQDNLTYDNIDAGNLNSIWIENNVNGNNYKFIPLKFPLYTNGSVIYQRLNLYAGTNVGLEVGIWNEKYPFDSVNKTSDSNPPALDVSYSRNLSLEKSIFDVQGLIQLNPASGDVLFVKQMMNDTEISYYSNLGFSTQSLELNENASVHIATLNNTNSVGGDTTILSVNNDSTILEGDILNIPYNVSYPNGAKRQYTVISADNTQGNSSITVYPSLPNVLPINYVLTTTPTNISNIITLATTNDSDKALQYGFTSIMINKTVPISGSNCPTQSIYRQLFICYKPKDSSGNPITSATFQGSNFNQTTWKYDIGSIFYLSNKIPIYRKWLNKEENFILII